MPKLPAISSNGHVKVAPPHNGGLVESLRQIRAEREGPPSPDFGDSLRAMAKVLSGLRHTTPQRQELLKSLGLDAEALSPRHFATLAAEILRQLERHQASATYETPLDKLSHLHGDEVAPTTGLNTRRLCDVVAIPVEWQREGFAALGKITLLSGPPGVGKTWLMLDHIARLTTGRPYPGASASLVSGRRDALFISAEDADDDTLKPRIETLGGDSSRVHTLRFVFDAKSRSQHGLSLDRHLDQFDFWLVGHPLVESVTLDPISAMLGRVDSHRDADVRHLLAPLAKIAERRRISIVCINHLNKSGEGQAIYRSIGSIGFVAQARIAWQVCQDSENPDRSLFLPVKMNLGPRPNGWAFRISERGLTWEDAPVTVTADEALNGDGAGKRDLAKDWLRDALSAGPIAAKVLEARAKTENISWSTVKLAKRALGIEANRIGGTHGEWKWSLPVKETQPLET